MSYYVKDVPAIELHNIIGEQSLRLILADHGIVVGKLSRETVYRVLPSLGAILEHKNLPYHLKVLESELYLQGGLKFHIYYMQSIDAWRFKFIEAEDKINLWSTTKSTDPLKAIQEAAAMIQKSDGIHPPTGVFLSTSNMNAIHSNYATREKLLIDKNTAFNKMHNYRMWQWFIMYFMLLAFVLYLDGYFDAIL